MRSIALYMPGEREIDLMSRLQGRDDVDVRCVVDPSGVAPGTLVAEVLGVPVHLSFQAARIPPDTTLVGPSEAAHVVPLPLLDADAFLATLNPTRRTTPTRAAVVPEPSRPAPPVADDPTDATLDRIADVLDRERLLPWLLSLAMRGLGADGGSLMLLDPRADELYIAAARGLSDDVVRSTRIRRGTGLAGTAAACLEPALVREPGAGERGPLASSLVLPLTCGEEPLGVINLSRSAGSTDYNLEDLATGERLAARVAAILERADGVAGSREGCLRHRLAGHLLSLADGADELETALAAWSGALTMDLDAASAAVAVLRDDGTLLVAEGDAAGETRVGTRLQTHPAWDDALQRRRPVIARQDVPVDESGDDDEIWCFFMPLGHPEPFAVLGLTFAGGAAAHRFQGRASAVTQLLERRLPELLRRFDAEDRLRRHGALLAFLADGAEHPHDAAAVRDATRRVIGARHVYLLRGGKMLSASSPPPAGWNGEAWSRRVVELVGLAEPGRWLRAALDPGRADDPDATLLVATRRAGDGLVLLGKDRTHAAGAEVFDDVDAELALRLSAALHERRRPTPAAAASRPVDAAPPDAAPADSADFFAATLRREMDRADRYHVGFSLSVFKLIGDKVDRALLEEATGRLRRMLRSSDTVDLRADGVIVILAPEENHAVSHLEHRAAALLREVVDDPELHVAHGRALYPGPSQTPEELLGRALDALDDA